MKYIISLKPKETLDKDKVEEQIRKAKNSNDYIQVKFGDKGQFIKIAFCRDMTYCIGFNFWNMQFQYHTNMMLKQYPKSVTYKLTSWLVEWVNRLNK